MSVEQKAKCKKPGEIEKSDFECAVCEALNHPHTIIEQIGVIERGADWVHVELVNLCIPRAEFDNQMQKHNVGSWDSSRT
jgi:hypothetical protein